MRKLIALTAATLLAGCANFAPPHVQPALPTATAFPGFPGDQRRGLEQHDLVGALRGTAAQAPPRGV